MPANKHVIVSRYSVTVSDLSAIPTQITLIQGLADDTKIELHDAGIVTLAEFRLWLAKRAELKAAVDALSQPVTTAAETH